MRHVHAATCAVLCCVLAGAGFLPWMPSFTQWFSIKPITLTASVIFFPPFIRDIACWAGFRQVGGRQLAGTELTHALCLLCWWVRGLCRLAVDQCASVGSVVVTTPRCMGLNVYRDPAMLVGEASPGCGMLIYLCTSPSRGSRQCGCARRLSIILLHLPPRLLVGPCCVMALPGVQAHLPECAEGAWCSAVLPRGPG